MAASARPRDRGQLNASMVGEDHGDDDEQDMTKRNKMDSLWGMPVRYLHAR